MKGKNTFTIVEIKKLEELIILRNKSESSKQKAVRNKIRNLGFYGRDDWGITDLQLSDLNSLIKSGKLKVIGSDSINYGSLIINKIEPIKITKPVISIVKPEGIYDITSLLVQFSKNCFDPKKDNEIKIVDSPGNYIICLKNENAFPKSSVKPTFKKFEDLIVIYTGIAGTSLRKRDFRQHFKGNAGGSTLRKSLGCLLGYKLIPRDKDPNTGKTKFNLLDELELTQWMLENLIMFYVPTSNYKTIELELISFLNPPLNLMGNANTINRDFRRNLSILRSKKSI